ncbi:hypothetical protein MNBD_NITROSPINAE04-2238 [hydrothermal vent metagenome]|uniref:Zinc finger DksA/TraR C4-type domain-containing protein n=1 Tax=hydrothermal vent metagenome TaxID=652676 RepID=A0A3B1BS00_9ZZZZ
MGKKRQGFENIKKLLLQKRSILLAADQSISQEIKREIENRHGDDVDVAESAYEQEKAYLFKSRGQGELKLINEALLKIEKGEYGVCAECDEKISKMRLAAMPYSIFCVECQEEMEKKGPRENALFPR